MSIRPKKRFGQHFLNDEFVLSKIASSINITETDTVLEVGPGKGALTKYILKRTPHLFAIEVDRDLCLELKKKISTKQLTLFQQDALKFHCKEITANKESVIIIGNLPYNITTPLLFSFFNQMDFIKEMVFMIQKEVAERLTASIKTKNYGRLTITAKSHVSSTMLFNVEPQAFNPPPKVTSTVVHFQKHQTPYKIEDISFFNYLVTQAFSKRRKKISNALKHVIPAEKWPNEIALQTKRPEEISIDEYIELASYALKLTQAE